MSQISVGTPGVAPYYAVVGEPTRHYYWVDEDGRGSASKWSTGTEAFRNWLRLVRVRKDELGAEIKRLHLAAGEMR